MKTLGFVALFVALQLASLVLTLIGIPICGLLAACNLMTLNGTPGAVWHWQLNPWTWIWDNEIDGVVGPSGPVTRWQAFYWSALRNPCNNLRFVPGVSLKGRPLWRKTWGPKPGGWYVQAGWEPPGYPVLSAGRNINNW